MKRAAIFCRLSPACWSASRPYRYLCSTIEGLGLHHCRSDQHARIRLQNISDASLHGPVNLPLDPSRNAGGSSGGAAKDWLQAWFLLLLHRMVVAQFASQPPSMA